MWNISNKHMFQLFVFSFEHFFHFSFHFHFSFYCLWMVNLLIVLIVYYCCCCCCCCCCCLLFIIVVVVVYCFDCWVDFVQFRCGRPHYGGAPKIQHWNLFRRISSWVYDSQDIAWDGFEKQFYTLVKCERTHILFVGLKTLTSLHLFQMGRGGGAGAGAGGRRTSYRYISSEECGQNDSWNCPNIFFQLD